MEQLSHLEILEHVNKVFEKELYDILDSKRLNFLHS